MKIFAVFALFVLGVSALPEPTGNSITEIDLKSDRFVTDAIAGLIQDISLAIQAAGLDPFRFNDRESYALPVPILFSIEAEVVEFLFTGISEIVINYLDFNLITRRLTLDISLPHIQASVQRAYVDSVLFGEKYSVSAAGRLAIRDIRVTGVAQVYIGVISGIAISDTTLHLAVGGIDSSLNVIIQNWNLSNYLNTLLAQNLPLTLDEFSPELNELIEIVVLETVNERLQDLGQAR